MRPLQNEFRRGLKINFMKRNRFDILHAFTN